MNNFQCDSCGRHDEHTFPTVVCKHLAAEPRQFWHAGWPSANPEHLDIWPDAWCGECNRKLIEDGGWEGRNKALNAAPESERGALALANLADDRQICNICYEEGMASSMAVAEKQALAQWEPFVEECFQALIDKQNQLEEQFSLSSQARWDLDQPSGKLMFSDGDRPTVVADIEFIGSYSTLTRTWLWAWANFDLDENVRNQITGVQAFGNMHALPRLTIRKWRCSEEVAWNMAAVAAAVLDAHGVYRAQSRIGPVFVAIMNIQSLQ